MLNLYERYSQTRRNTIHQETPSIKKYIYGRTETRVMTASTKTQKAFLELTWQEIKEINPYEILKHPFNKKLFTHMRHVDKIIIHCSDTRTDQSFDIKDIDRWHKERGWSEIGYHYYIKLNGTIQYGRDISKVGAHTKGQNTPSIGICLEGGKNPDGTKWDMCTLAQERSLMNLIHGLQVTFPNLISVHGHYEFSDKTCPNFHLKRIGFH